MTLSARLNLKTICNELGEVKTMWSEIGVQLGIPRCKLLEFEKEHDPLVAAIDYWLNDNVEGEQVSWRSIIKALNSPHVGKTGLAKRISKKYYQPGDSRKIKTPGTYNYDLLGFN